MISETGKNLSILIIANNDTNWQTFASWYSFYKNLPDARLAIFCERNQSVPFAYFQWAKRLGVPKINAWPFSDTVPDIINWVAATGLCLEKQLISCPVLVVNSFVMCLNLLEKNILKKINQENFFEKNIFFLKEKNTKEIINNFYLDNNQLNLSNSNICFEAKETLAPVSIVSYKKGCGRWIDTAKGCPFSSAGGLITAEMTANETKIIDLWSRMVPLYNAVS